MKLSFPAFLTRPFQAPAGRVRHHQAHFERVLGTALELHIRADTLESAHAAERALLAEIDRLEQIFSRFLPKSELNRWLEGQAGNEGEGMQQVSLELGALLRDSLACQAFTGGAFHPGADALSGVWQEAETRGVPPSSSQLAHVLEALQKPLYQMEPGARAVKRLSSVPLNFNAIAKGRIADLACDAAFSHPGVHEVLVNLGGDLRHRVSPGPTSSSVIVKVAHPFSSVDNAPAACTLRLQNQAVATSGGSRRGFQIEETWFSHLLDPRTGQPVQHIASASVLAPDCTTADVLATAFSVLEPSKSLELADSLTGVGCFLVTREGERLSNRFWSLVSSD